MKSRVRFSFAKKGIGCLLRRVSHSPMKFSINKVAVGLLLMSALSAASSPEPRKEIGRHVPAEAKNSPTGEFLPEGQRLNLSIGVPIRDQGVLTSFLNDLYNPASASFHRYLTPDQFTAQFGPTEADYQAIIDFATAHDLTITATHPNRMVLDVSGSVADVEKAFQVKLRLYRHPFEARNFFAPDVDPTVEASVPILNVSGLNNYWLPHPRMKLQGEVEPHARTSNGPTGPNGLYAGSDFRSIYAPGVSLTGMGQTVGLVEFDGYYPGDIVSYEDQVGLSSVPLQNVYVDGYNGRAGSNNSEVALDIEVAISMAPGLSKVIVYEESNGGTWEDILNRIANDNLAKQVSCSWGGGPPDATAEQIFQQMAAQGQSFFNATGDSDAFTGAIDFPSDSPNIVEVGGTTIWATGDPYTWTSESVWNWGKFGKQYIGSSGGISPTYSIPTWQQGISMTSNQGSTTHRNIPDVALTADNIYIVADNGIGESVGGTSCAAPLWAAFTALVNQQAGISQQPAVGFLNPALYSIGKGQNYTSAFHDITTGNNFSGSSPSRFSAVTGYDLCTGWGTPKGAGLIAALVSVQQSPLPNLAPYQPSGWSDKIVISNVPGSYVDSSNLQPGDTLYLDWAVTNSGNADATASSTSELYVDGVLRASWTTPPITAGNFNTVQDYNLGSLPTGSHSIQIKLDTTNVIAESNENDNSYTKTIVVGALPNLTPYQPSGWSDKVVVTTVNGGTTDSSNITSTSTLYIDWAVINNGNANVTNNFSTELYVDGVFTNSWTVSAPLNTGAYTSIIGYPLGSLSQGSHTIQIVADATNAVSESNESDNQYTKTVTVNPPGFTITVTASPSSEGTVYGGGTFPSGATCTVSASPAKGYKFVNWTENGTVVSTGTGYSFTVTKNRSLVANFKKK